MNSINFKREILGPMELAVDQVTQALQAQGFGVLTRIDLHSKVKEKIGKELQPVIILGACNPSLAFEAYQLNSDVASLLPCNAVLRDVGNNRISVELAKPSALMKLVGSDALVTMALEADARLQLAVKSLSPSPVLEWTALELSAQIEHCELIDVRESDEFNGPLSHVNGATLVTLGPVLTKFLMSKSKDPSKKTMVFVCRSGGRSMKAALEAKELGLDSVVNLQGGMIGWGESKLPTHASAQTEGAL